MKKVANSSANSSSLVEGGRGLGFLLPVIVLMRLKSFLVSLPASVICEKSIWVFTLLILAIYLFLSAFSAAYWCSALYCLQICSLFLTVCFYCFNSFVNHGTLVWTGSCFFLTGARESNAFCMLCFIAPTNSLRSLMDNRSLMYISSRSLSWSNSHNFLTCISLLNSTVHG